MYCPLSLCLLFASSTIVWAQQETDRLDSIRSFSKQKEAEFASGFACRFVSNGIETVYHKYPVQDEFYLAIRSQAREMISVCREGRYFMLLRYGNVNSGFGAWQLTHVGNKRQTTDGQLFQVERVVKSPWTILGTPLHNVLDDPNVKRIDSQSIGNSLELEFKRISNPRLSEFEKRPFFTDHERVTIIFEDGATGRILSLTKMAIGPNRGVKDTIQYSGDDRYTVTDSDGVVSDVTTYSRDWADRRELYLSFYGLSAIEEAIEQRPKSFGYFVSVLFFVGVGFFIVAYFLKKRSSS
jgi:hypothetical protein